MSTLTYKPIITNNEILQNSYFLSYIISVQTYMLKTLRINLVVYLLDFFTDAFCQIWLSPFPAMF